MNPERWQRIQALFHRCLEVAEQERDVWLDRECGEDSDLRDELARMLRDDARSCRLLDEVSERTSLVPDPLVGREIGAYRLKSRIAAGGMGVVYLAERVDGLFEQEVAVKLIRTETATEDALRRFEFERRTLASLNHPNIARLFDGGTTEEGSPYIVMELIHGAPIDAHCNEKQLDVTRRLELFAKVCRAVHFAHHNLIVHRDLKPGNVLVDQQGEPKLLDFGIARLALPQGDEEVAEPTRTIARILTPEYASPEQLTGGAITTATDVYSLGVMLYELLTGLKPFRSASRSAAAWERLVTTQPPTRPSTAVMHHSAPAAEDGPPLPPPGAFAESCGTTPAKLHHRLSGDLDRIVLMALRKEPERRYDSAREFAEDIEAHLAGRPVAARKDSVLYRSGKFVRRNRLGVGSAVLILSALVFGFVAARRGEARAKEGEARAIAQAHHTTIEADSFRKFSTEMKEMLAVEALESEEKRQATLRRIQRRVGQVRREHARQAHLRANLLNELGSLCATLALFDDAQPLMEEALDIRMREYGEDSLEVGLSLGTLGDLYYRRGDFARAEEVLRSALAVHRNASDDPHRDVALAANDLAVALRNLGRTDEAERLHREALQLRRSGSGDDSLVVAESLNNLAGIHLDRAEFEEAEALLGESLDIRRRILGVEDALTLQSLSNLASARWHLRDVDGARTLLDDATDGFRALGGEGIEGLGRTLSNRATLELHAGELDAAEALLEEVRALQITRLGPDHPVVATVHERLADLRHARQRDVEALASWEEALRCRRSSEPPSARLLGETLMRFGSFLRETGALERAEESFAEAVELVSTTEDTGLLGQARAGLGMCLFEAQRFEEARIELRAGIELLDGDARVGAGTVERWRAALRSSEERGG